jgi:diguanylate cyclase (GGDEF)-like protein
MPQPGPERCSHEPQGQGWLCPTEAHRARMLDMGPRVVRARTVALAATGAGALAAIGEVGWWALVLFAVAIANLGTLEWRIRRAMRPERVVAASLLLILWLLGASAALTGGAVSPLLALLVIPVAVAAMRFRAQVVWAIAGAAALTAIVVAFIGGIQQATDHPLVLIAVLVLLSAVTAVTTALMDAELQFRSESILDPLTGLLNRSGLGARFAEVGEQARLLDRPVCLIMCDLDHFKRVNDDHGHERGDAVLREASYAMRKSLRSFELFYRLGGEEFLVLLPGIDLPHGVEIAQSLRAAVQASRPGGVPVTASFGVSVATGEEIDFLPLYRAADDAMYRAKAEGRNLVVALEMSPEVADDAPAVADDALIGAHA